MRLASFRLSLSALFACLLLSAAARAADTARIVDIEALTSTELRARVDAGATTILVPIGGTEQNGPHMVLGKHNVRAQLLARRIAERLGNALVAPVISYVPEGAIDPPAGHMRFPGTISVPVPAFEAVLEGAARSFRQHGFRDVVFLGDHGGYQGSEKAVAARLDREWAADPRCRVHALLDFYNVTQTTYVRALEREGHTRAQIGVHAGLADTSLALAIDPALVRSDLLKQAPGSGVAGDPRGSTAALGEAGVREIIEVSVAAIQARTRRPR